MAYTTIDDPSAHFQTVLWTGNDTSQTITFDGNSDLQPDMVWEKKRSATEVHQIYDSNRGVTKYLFVNLTNAENTDSTKITSVNSDGYAIGESNSYNDNAVTYVAWNWKANGGSRTTNAEDGNNPAGGYQANTTAGFSIVDYTGTGAAGTMAHGLGAVPSLIIIKNRDEADAWAVYHSANTSAPETDYLVLNETDATADDATYWNDTAPTSTVFTVNTAHNVNADGEKYMAYCFAEIQGYSKFGSYTGNGDADGPFVYTGFKIAYIMIKRTDGLDSWVIYDNARSLYNMAQANLLADSNAAEYDNSSVGRDFVSNGMKVRSTGQNASGGTYIYMAFAEQPFVTSGGVPCTAR